MAHATAIGNTISVIPTPDPPEGSFSAILLLVRKKESAIRNLAGLWHDRPRQPENNVAIAVNQAFGPLVTSPTIVFSHRQKLDSDPATCRWHHDIITRSRVVLTDSAIDLCTLCWSWQGLVCLCANVWWVSHHPECKMARNCGCGCDVAAPEKLH